VQAVFEVAQGGVRIQHGHATLVARGVHEVAEEHLGCRDDVTAGTILVVVQRVLPGVATRFLAVVLLVLVAGFDPLAYLVPMRHIDLGPTIRFLALQVGVDAFSADAGMADGGGQ